MRPFLILCVVAALASAGVIIAAAEGMFGRVSGPGTISPRNGAAPDDRDLTTYSQELVAAALDESTSSRIVFGDPRVYTDFSDDAFLASLPAVGGRGTASLGDACDYARFCSAIDFWVAADHAESLTAERWRSSVETVGQCNAIASADGPSPTRAFAGFSWTRPDPGMLNASRAVWLTADSAAALAVPPASQGPEGRARHSYSLVDRLRLLAAAPARRTLDFLTHLRATRQHAGCLEGDGTAMPCPAIVQTGADLVETLRRSGIEARIILTGSTSGAFVAADAVPAVVSDGPSQLFEIISGHGSADVYRDFRPAEIVERGNLSCPEPGGAYWPACRVAGEIVLGRCLGDGVDPERCRARADAASAMYLAYQPGGHRVIGGALASDWMDGGQCRDCFLPAFNYRPRGSAQYLLASRIVDTDGLPRRRYFGFVGASASHRARPGNGYAEKDRPLVADIVTVRDRSLRSALFGPAGDDVAAAAPPPAGRAHHLAEHERATSFRYSGALTGVHVEDGSTDNLFDALDERHTYATSGERILLWFALDNAGSESQPMGSRVTLQTEPRFHVSAAGALKQLPGCPVSAAASLGATRLAQLCRSDCYYPADERKLISRIEVVRIRPQSAPDEPIATLIEDPWLTHVCQPDPLGCRFEFTDPDYVAGERDVTYYVRAIQAPSLAINGGGLRCEYDADGRCVATNPCRTEPGNPDCLAPIEERAWASPIYVEWPR